MEQTSVRDLLDQAKALESAKAAAITSLLEERVKLRNDTDNRLHNIGEELKALGYVRKRAAKKKA